MKPRSGMTLLEVLASTVLLAMVSAASVPLLRAAVRSLRIEPQAFDLRELTEFADEFALDPSAFGVDDEGDWTALDVAWRERPELPAVRVARLLQSESGGDEEASDHEWLAFTHGGIAVYRWRALAAPGDGEAQR